MKIPNCRCNQTTHRAESPTATKQEGPDAVTDTVTLNSSQEFSMLDSFVMRQGQLAAKRLDGVPLPEERTEEVSGANSTDIGLANFVARLGANRLGESSSFSLRGKAKPEPPTHDHGPWGLD